MSSRNNNSNHNSSMVDIDAANIDPQVSNQHTKVEAGLESFQPDNQINANGNPSNNDTSNNTLIFYIQDQGPIRFSIPPAEIHRSTLQNIIESNGGKVVSDYTGYVISNIYYPSRQTFRPQMIFDSVRNGQLEDMERYRVQDPAHDNVDSEVTASLAAAITNGTTHTNMTDEQMALELVKQHAQVHDVTTIIGINKNGFTKEEDAFIMEEVRKNPTRRATHKLFGEIALQLNRHTGNSVRYRFRNHLQKNLNYVYKTDSNGRLLVDPNGNYIKTNDLPSTVKHKFTSEDDYILCKTVMQRSQIIESEHGNSVTLPNKFFDALEKEQPHHSKAAWRDRFRKFAKVYGLENYIRYYETCIASDKVPDPMKDFTARKHVHDGGRSNKRKTPGNLNSEVNPKDNNDFDYMDSTNNTTKDSRKRKKIINSVDAAAVAVAAAANASKEKKNNEIDNGLFLAYEHRSELNSLVDSSLSSQNLMSSTQIPLITRDVTRDSNTLEIGKLMDPAILSKFFKREIFNLTLSQVLDKANAIVKRDYSVTGADALLDDLNTELGINRNFGTELLTSCCGDLSVVTKYLNLVINTGISPPENAAGIWTKDDDRRLQTVDISRDHYDYLVAKHGVEGINLRKSFMASTAQNT